MKKIITIFIILCATSMMISAQNTTRIGSKHAVDFGVGYGYGSQGLASHGFVFIDFNAANCNLRTRINAGIDNTNLRGGNAKWAGNLGVDVQYLLTLTDGFYFYPFAGLNLELPNYSIRNKDLTGCDFDPRAGIGLEYQINSNFGIFAQGAYEYAVRGGTSRILGQAGVVFAFGPGSRNTSAYYTADDAKLAHEAAKKAAEDEIAAQKAAANAETKVTEIPGTVTVITGEAEEAEKAPEFHVGSTVKVNFPIGSSYVNDINRKSIEKLAAYLAANEDRNVEIKTYADKNTGSEKTNQALSEKRAEAVKYFLLNNGVNAARIAVESLGSTVNPFETPEENRTAVITVK